VYHYALRGAFPLTFPYTYTRNLKVSNAWKITDGSHQFTVNVLSFIR